MSDKYTFKIQGRNPDVLNSIANLSSDEVFTPPAFANRMLDQIELAWSVANDGESIWEKPELKFLDPFTKSGVFLREIVRRLNAGLETQIPDLQERIDHILTKQVFGAATTTLTALLARRTVYCSKDATGKHSIASKFTEPNGNIWFEQGTHEWHGGSIKRITVDAAGKEIEIFADARCKICGVSRKDFDRGDELELHAYDFIHNKNLKLWTEKVFGGEMQFDVIVGNPPYQLDDGGFGASAAPIYNKFVDQAKALNPRFLSLVIPARWYAGGKGLDEFRSNMLNDNRIRRLVDFPDSSEVFPGVEIKGGVCYFLWERDNPGLTSVETVMAGITVSSTERPLLEEGAQVFIRYNQGVEILKKVMLIELETKKEPIRVNLPKEKSFKALVSSSKPFGLRTFFKGRESSKPGDLKVFVNGGVGYASKDEITNGHSLIGKWKVFISGAYGAGNSYPHSVLGKPFVGAPEDICTETYMAIGPFATKLEADNVAKYISTKLFRALVLMHKPAQHATQSVYTFVPNQDFSQEWTDEKLYKKYNLSLDDISFIEDMIRPMELENE
jgi:hypothetical protein